MKTFKILTILIMALLTSQQTFALEADSIAPMPTYQFVNDTILQIDFTNSQLYYMEDTANLTSITFTLDNWITYHQSDYDTSTIYIDTFNVVNIPDTFNLTIFLTGTKANDAYQGISLYKEITYQIIKPTPIIINDTIITDTEIITNPNYTFNNYINDSLIIFLNGDLIDQTFSTHYYYTFQNYNDTLTIYQYQLNFYNTYDLYIYTIIYIENITNINNISNQKSYSFYPNPSTTYIKLNNKANVKIYTISGKLLQSYQNTNYINHNLPQGIYLININNNIEKLIIK